MSGIRIRALILREPNIEGIKWREAEARLEHGELRISYTSGGELSFKLSSLKDVETDYMVISSKEAKKGVALKFEEGTLILAVDENPMIYDKEKFWRLIHDVFGATLGGAPVQVERDGEKRRAFLKLVPSVRNPVEGAAVLVDSHSQPLLNVIHVANGRRTGEVQWEVTAELPEKDVQRLRLHFPDGRTERIFLRYLLKYVPSSRRWALEIAKEIGLNVPASDVFLSEDEIEVLDALLSGVDPLEVPKILRMETARVERIYSRLIKLGLLRLVGVRKVVEPTEFAGEIADIIKKEV